MHEERRFGVKLLVARSRTLPVYEDYHNVVTPTADTMATQQWHSMTFAYSIIFCALMRSNDF